jgi:hypothetical protein
MEAMTLYEVVPPPFEDDADGEDNSIWHTSLESARRCVRRLQREYADADIRYHSIRLRRVEVASNLPPKALILRILNRAGWVAESTDLGTFDIPDNRDHSEAIAEMQERL